MSDNTEQERAVVEAVIFELVCLIEAGTHGHYYGDSARRLALYLCEGIAEWAKRAPDKAAPLVDRDASHLRRPGNGEGTP